MYIVTCSINHGPSKAVSKPFDYMWDADDYLDKLNDNYSRGHKTIRVDDHAFVCFAAGVPAFFKVCNAV